MVQSITLLIHSYHISSPLILMDIPIWRTVLTLGGNEVLAQLAWELASELRQARVVEQKYPARTNSSNHLLRESGM